MRRLCDLMYAHIAYYHQAYAMTHDAEPFLQAMAKKLTAVR